MEKEFILTALWLAGMPFAALALKLRYKRNIAKKPLPPIDPALKDARGCFGGCLAVTLVMIWPVWLAETFLAWLARFVVPSEPEVAP